MLGSNFLLTATDLSPILPRKKAIREDLRNSNDEVENGRNLGGVIPG